MSALARSSTSTASEPEVRLLLLLTALVLVVASAAGASVCDTANCGRGTCAELPKLIPDVPNYACHCDPGWSGRSPSRPSPSRPASSPTVITQYCCIDRSIDTIQFVIGYSC